MLQLSKVSSHTVVYLGRYTIKLLLTVQEIFLLIFKAHGPDYVRSIRLECQNKYFLVWTSSSVNKSISLHKRKYKTLHIYLTHTFTIHICRQCISVASFFQLVYYRGHCNLICISVDIYLHV